MHFEKNLDVVVVDQDGNEFAEWGKQKLGANRFSCYIQSETGMSFGIRLVPTPHILSAMSARRADLKRHWRVRPQDEEPPEPAYDFLATLRLDGREDFEKRNIIYLDGENHWFHKPDGKVTMLGKNMRESRDSDVKFHKWVFQEVGIESMIEGLSLMPDSQAPEPEDMLVRAMQALGSNNLQDNKETVKAGVIEITIERVKLANKTSEREWPPDRSTCDSATGRSKANRNVSHLTGRDNGTKGTSNVHTFIRYDLIDSEDKPWAVFKFFYRSEDVLRKFDFAGFPKKQLKPDVAAMAKLTLDAGHTKRGTHELDNDSDSDDDSLARRAIIARKVPKTKQAIEGKPLHRAGVPSQELDSEDEDIEEHKFQEKSGEEWTDRSAAKAIFIDVEKQPLAGPKRAAFSKDEQQAHDTSAPIGTDETTNSLVVKEPVTVTDVVQQKSAESDESDEEL